VNILFLDDSPERIRAFKRAIPYATIVETAAECIKQIGKEEWDWVLLDHDLGGEQFVDSDRKDTGMEVVRHLIANKPDKLPRIIVHSLNSEARQKMCLDLVVAGYEATPLPFPLVFRMVEEGL
jgi:CheY-like chemotaxis protein